MSKQSFLTYTGDGNFLPGIPARNLSEHEATLYGGADYLVQSGLYRLTSVTKTNSARGERPKAGGVAKE